MRTATVLLPALLLASAGTSTDARAQGARPTQRDHQADLEAKLASPFLARADWVVDYDEARARADARGQLIFGYFTTAGY